MKSITINLYVLVGVLIGCGYALQDPTYKLQEDIVGQWLNKGGREKRDIMKLIGLISQLTNGFESIPGISGLSGINLREIVETGAGLTQEVLDSMLCCKGVGVPSAFMKSMEQCVRVPILLFIGNISANRNTTDMITPIVNGSQIQNLVQSGLCAVKCAFDLMSLTTPDGLPSTEAMIARLKDTVKPDAFSVYKPALEACKEKLGNATQNNKRALTAEDKCWASNSMLDCVRLKVYEMCPQDGKENRKQGGTDCLIKLGKQFWNDLPSKLTLFVDSVKSMLEK